MTLSNLRVSTRLLTGFGLVLALLVAILLLGTQSLNTMKADLHIITEVNNKQIEAASHMRQSVQETAITVRNIALLSEMADQLKQSDQLKLQSVQYAQSKAALAKMLASAKTTTPAQKEAFAKLDRLEAEASSKIQQVSNLGMASRTDEVKTLLLTELGPAQEVWIAQINALVSLQETLNRKAADEADAAYSRAMTLMLAVGAIALVVGLAASILITRSLIRQLGGEPSSVNAIAARIADGDLSVAIDTRAGDTSSVMYGMQEMRTSLSRVVGQVRAGTDAIVAASTQISSGNRDLSSRTEQQASSLEETAASMEELTSTVKQNADNARQANQLAETASGVAVKGGEVVSQVVTTMKSINDSSKKIVDIISTIDGIAFQTNILALNAAVEAARAGEQGRGFAVVASEVRSLAQRSAAAAKEIKGLIGTSVEKVDAGSRLVEDAGATMEEIVTSVKRVTDIMAEIMAASQEQSTGIELVNSAIAQMETTTQQNAALVEEAAAAAQALQDQAGNLAQEVAVFKMAAVESEGDVSEPTL